MYIYLNGEYVLEDKARISPFDHGYLYGLGVFETLRLYNGHPFLLDDHFQRLQQSLHELNINSTVVKEDIARIIDDLSRLNELTDAYIRINISAGPAPIGLSSNVYTKPTIIVFMKNLPQKLPKVKDAVILNTKRNTPEGPQRLKSHHYLNNIIAKRELGDGGNEGILLTSGGHIAEAIVSNVFWAKRGCIYTPSVNTGILNGITRQFIILLLRKQGLKIKEGFFTEDELLAADEIFLTNSIQEVVSIKTLNNHTINKFSLADKLRDQYKHLINSKLMSRNELYRG